MVLSIMKIIRSVVKIVLLEKRKKHIIIIIPVEGIVDPKKILL